MSEFCPVLDVMLSTRSTVGRSGKQFADLGSNSTLNNLRFIQQTMRERKPLRTLEIGLAFGAATLVFCSEHHRLGHEAAKQHTALDPYQPYPMLDEAGVYAVERAGLAGFLDYRPEFSEFVMRFWSRASVTTSSILTALICSRTFSRRLLFRPPVKRWWLDGIG